MHLDNYHEHQSFIYPLMPSEELSPSLLETFCKTFSLELTSEVKYPYYSFTNNTLSLHLDPELNFKSAKGMKPLSFDFKELPRSFSKKDPFVKALGNNRVILDATCGTGKDTLSFLKLGLKVISYERSPLLAPLLWDAQRRAPELDLDIRFEDARNCLERPDVIFLDPMFPPKKKKALPKKEMVMFSHLIGKDEDQEELLKWALKTAKKRVVVKRPLWADSSPTLSYKGTRVKYDTYIV